jgi:Holliday junction resolvase
MEKHIQKKIIEYLRRQGAYVVKVSLANRAGVPDILACYHGRFLGLEVKACRGRSTPLQCYNLKGILSAGGSGAIVHSLDDVKIFIANLDMGSSQSSKHCSYPLIN